MIPVQYGVDSTGAMPLPTYEQSEKYEVSYTDNNGVYYIKRGLIDGYTDSMDRMIHVHVTHIVVFIKIIKKGLID